MDTKQTIDIGHNVLLLSTVTAVRLLPPVEGGVVETSWRVVVCYGAGNNQAQETFNMAKNARTIFDIKRTEWLAFLGESDTEEGKSNEG